MKMIEVLNLMAEGKIENDTKLIASTDLVDYEYRYSTGYHTFFDKYSNRIEYGFFLDEDFLNVEVELIPPKEKKYLVKFNMRGLDNECKYLNYSNSRKSVILNVKISNRAFQTRFTKSELQSIQLVREFLEDMEGKFELIEVDDNEIY